MTSQAKECCDRMNSDLAQKCGLHPNRDACPDALIDRVRGGFGLIVHDGSGSVIEISYCPWCGASLPPIGDLDLSGENHV